MVPTLGVAFSVYREAAERVSIPVYVNMCALSVVHIAHTL